MASPALLTLISLLALKVFPVSTQHGTRCYDYYDMLLFPRTLTHLSVIELAPMKVKASFYVSHLNQTFSASGMVSPRGFNSNTARAACRSLGHTKASFVANLEVNEHEMCSFDYKNNVVEFPCQLILNKLNCTNTTVDLMQCTFEPVFSSVCKKNQYIGLTCLTPTTTTKRTTTKKLVTETTSTTITTAETSFNTATSIQSTNREIETKASTMNR